ncbi:hypothetical protein [Mucilaginibacter aquatilis]|uniref:Uncharacterized protein n=1 Tax=Mucilaginibacter aquatilis TaxID=1517760 RepID=A0A6I4ID44_9SPHI|nr:hypothetical protein [Mucilaginibacter aquatilis]MVN91516.1 hypothetical protein [Mucilaginibacter aquatilis]
MMKALIGRFSRWYNGLHQNKQFSLLIGFCVLFLLIIWLSITYIRFDTRVYQSDIPAHIGQSSGKVTDPSTLNK